jgi:hypothetical protein
MKNKSQRKNKNNPLKQQELFFPLHIQAVSKIESVWQPHSSTPTNKLTLTQ